MKLSHHAPYLQNHQSQKDVHMQKRITTMTSSQHLFQNLTFEGHLLALFLFLEMQGVPSCPKKRKIKSPSYNFLISIKDIPNMEPPHQKSLHCYMYYHIGCWTNPSKDLPYRPHVMNPKKNSFLTNHLQTPCTSHQDMHDSKSQG